MPIVFVHGVNTRQENPGYEAGRLITETFLQKYFAGLTLNGRSLAAGFTPVFPYWGDQATRFAWEMRSLPSADIDSLGAPLDTDIRPLVALIRDALGTTSGGVSEPLVALARQSFPLAVEVLSEVLVTNPMNNTPADIAAFVVEAQIYASAFMPPATPPWLANVTTDAQFISQLLNALAGSAPTVNALGIFNKIGNALSAAAAKIKQGVASAKTKVLDSVGDFASTKALAWSRGSLNATLGRFFGDVFIYLNGRGDAAKPGSIPQFLLKAWDAAIAAAPNEPVVIIGHSLGGVISFDLLSHFRSQLDVDLFVSIGSQVSHFEEMKLFLGSDKTIPNGDFTRRAKKPGNIKQWINVFDEVDIFSYACKDVFEGVHDFHYDTRTYVIKAHGAYFAQARFYERLRARIDQL